MFGEVLDSLEVSTTRVREETGEIPSQASIDAVHASSSLVPRLEDVAGAGPLRNCILQGEHIAGVFADEGSALDALRGADAESDVWALE